MRKFILLTLVLMSGLLTMGQTTPQPTPVHKSSKKGYDRDCIHRNTYTETQRLHFFPFNIADSIKLISFRYHDSICPVGKDHLIKDSLIEQRLLTKSEVNQLTDLIYNMGKRREDHIGVTSGCFWPRNAVLFIDRTGKLQAYTLICFHCHNFENSADDMGIWSDCDQKSDLIRQFFISKGIKFGTDPTIDEYPGE